MSYVIVIALNEEKGEILLVDKLVTACLAKVKDVILAKSS